MVSHKRAMTCCTGRSNDIGWEIFARCLFISVEYSAGERGTNFFPAGEHNITDWGSGFIAPPMRGEWPEDECHRRHLIVVCTARSVPKIALLLQMGRSIE
ncbi:hypothetical protein AVEN_3510-1 [Araneus ventricosus]|uniref:Uncharacterized protein n=1 Tax=Araneus ventricosus TaxID=182803 RepID=A0A4Y2VQI6_ARAVE|nr:hypothetical protein AVEN_3510-1 [Araneus ventricosus]